MKNSFQNADGQVIIENMIVSIQQNKDYLGEIDGLIGDGDHGANMNKGFTMVGKALEDTPNSSLSDGLILLGSTLFNDIGGSMGPIYGSLFMGMGENIDGVDEIDLLLLSQMFRAGLTELQDIVEAQVGDKTLIDTLDAAVVSLETSAESDIALTDALENMRIAAQNGRDSTKDMVAKVGRSSRLGERSRGVLDAGASSCYILLESMANSIDSLLA